MCGIYQITNNINKKIYIGKSKNIKERWQEHIRESYISEDLWKQNYRHVQTPIHKAIRKYGKENFSFEILEECLEEELNNKEKCWIALKNSTNKNIGYNISRGGDGYSLGFGESAPGAKITQEDCNFIKEKLKERLTYREIQLFYPELSITALYDINYGKSWFDPNEHYPISINNGHRSWTDEEAMCIKLEYAKGETINSLAIKYQVRQETISDLVKGKSYTNLPVIKRETNWQRVSTKRKFTEEEVLFFRKKFYNDKQSILSIYKEYKIAQSYSGFYNMIKGNTYKNIGGLPEYDCL